MLKTQDAREVRVGHEQGSPAKEEQSTVGCASIAGAKERTSDHVTRSLAKHERFDAQLCGLDHASRDLMPGIGIELMEAGQQDGFLIADEVPHVDGGLLNRRDTTALGDNPRGQCCALGKSPSMVPE